AHVPELLHALRAGHQRRRDRDEPAQPGGVRASRGEAHDARGRHGRRGEAVVGRPVSRVAAVEDGGHRVGGVEQLLRDDEREDRHAVAVQRVGLRRALEGARSALRSGQGAGRVDATGHPREAAAMAQVIVERDGPVMVLTLNRPPRKNAMTLTMFALLADAWAELSADDALSCAILTGAEGNFSSGMDLRAMAGDLDRDGAIDEQARLRDDPGFIYRGLLKTYRPTKP